MHRLVCSCYLVDSVVKHGILIQNFIPGLFLDLNDLKFGCFVSEAGSRTSLEGVAFHCISFLLHSPCS